MIFFSLKIDGLVPECTSSALAMELGLSVINPSKYIWYSNIAVTQYDVWNVSASKV